jgi:hypothetical protein
MRRGLVVLGLLASCGGRGADVEVTSDVDIDRVEVFLANDHCYDASEQPCMDGVAWAPGMRRPPGDVFVIKDDEDVIAPEQRGTSFVLHLEALPEFTDPKVMVFVGFNTGRAVAVATVWGPHIPENSAETWHVKLLPADDASDDIHIGPGDGVQRSGLRWSGARVRSAVRELQQGLAGRRLRHGFRPPQHAMRFGHVAVRGRRQRRCHVHAERQDALCTARDLRRVQRRPRPGFVRCGIVRDEHCGRQIRLYVHPERRGHLLRHRQAGFVDADPAAGAV